MDSIIFIRQPEELVCFYSLTEKSAFFSVYFGFIFHSLFSLLCCIAIPSLFKNCPEYCTRALGCKVINFSSGQQGKHFTIASFFYWNITSCSSRTPKISGVTTTRTSLFLSWLTLEILDQNIPERVSEK